MPGETARDIGLTAQQEIKTVTIAVAIPEFEKSGDHCGAKEKVWGQHKCLSCIMIFRCFED